MAELALPQGLGFLASGGVGAYQCIGDLRGTPLLQDSILISTVFICRHIPLLENSLAFIGKCSNYGEARACDTLPPSVTAYI